MPGLADLINEKKNDRVECKTQLNMGVNFISTNDTGKTRTYVQSDNEEIRLGNETPKIITEFIKSFLIIKKKKKYSEMEVILYLIVLIYWLLVFIK